MRRTRAMGRWRIQALSLGLLIGASLLGCDLVPNLGETTFACDAEATCPSGFFCAPTGACVASCTEPGCVDPTCGVDSDCELDEVCGAEAQCEEMVADLKCGDIIGSTDADALQLGLILTLSGSSAQSGIDQQKSVQLAVAEINQNGGVQGLQGQRNLAFIVCDDKGREDHVRAAATYLSRREVPAILGPLLSRLVEVAAVDVAIPKGIFMLSPSSTAEAIRDLDDDDLVWRTSSTDTQQADTLAYFALWLAVQPIHDDASTIRVVAVYADDNYGRGFRTSFSAALGAYEKAYLGERLAGGLTLKTLAYVPESESTDWDSEVQTTFESIKDEAPHIILVVGYEDAADILTRVKAEPSLASRPVLLTDGVSSPALTATYTDPSDVPPYLFGTHPGVRSGNAWEHFSQNYPKATQDGSLPIWTEYTYDAVYLLAYAAAAYSPQELTGAAFADAFTRFDDPDGRVINVGPNHLLVAAQDMGAGLAVDVRGASGALDFDPQVGEPKSVGIVRWNLSFPDIGQTGSLVDCGVAMLYEADEVMPLTYWCNALCTMPPEGTAACNAGVCEKEKTMCWNKLCTGGDDCKPLDAL